MRQVEHGRKLPHRRGVILRARPALGTARLEGDWHAGCEEHDGGSRRASRPCHAPWLKRSALVISRAQGGQEWWRASCHERGL